MHIPVKLSPQSSNKYIYYLRKCHITLLFVVGTLSMRLTLFFSIFPLNKILFLLIEV